MYMVTPDIESILCNATQFVALFYLFINLKKKTCSFRGDFAYTRYIDVEIKPKTHAHHAI